MNFRYLRDVNNNMAPQTCIVEKIKERIIKKWNNDNNNKDANQCKVSVPKTMCHHVHISL